MIIAIFILILSAIAMLSMVIVKIHKLNQGKDFVFFKHGEKTDEFLRTHMGYVRLTFSRKTLKASISMTHSMLDKTEGIFLKGKDIFVDKAVGLLEKAKGTRKNISPAAHQVSDFISDIKEHFKK